MKSVAKYRQLAEEYRKLSDKLVDPKDKQALQLMARAWDTVAAERKDRLISQAVRELLDRIAKRQWFKLDPLSQQPTKLRCAYSRT
jgi:hypothetical protein